MRVIIQRVRNSSVIIDGQMVGDIQAGFMLLVGFTHDDTNQIVEMMAEKILNLRILEDNDQKMNLSLLQSKGEILSIPQFTLYADSTSGRRPNFLQAARPEVAIPLYRYFNQCLEKSNLKVATGIFGENMQISLINDGPVTIFLDSHELFKN